MVIKKEFSVKGMMCASCEKIIAKQALLLEGVESIDVDYVSGKGQVTFDENKTSWGKIKHRIGQKGYTCVDSSLAGGSESNKASWWAWLLAAAGILLVSYFGLQLYSKFPLPEISQNMGYGLLFLVGLLTGFHCITMCGGFVVSYTAKGTAEGKKPHQLHASYAFGKTISYTIIGAGFGLFGSIIAFTPAMRGVAGIISGLFLTIFGIKMLDIFPFLRRFQFGLPKFLNRWLGKESQEYANSPLVIGLLSGLMIACGPLQAVYILAAGTGSMLEGAKMLFIFGLGTLPVMLGFGYFASMISSKATLKILKASGALVIILGLIMLNRGLVLTGSGLDFGSLASGFGTLGNGNNNGASGATQTIAGTTFKDGYQEIKMTVDGNGFTPNKFVLKKGVPVKWIIDGKQLSGCNNAITVPKYGLNFKVQSGTQTIEFTPTESGTVPWSCWMGMLRGTFVVQDEVNTAAATTALNQIPTSKGASCGAGGGGCGCGGG